MTSKYARTRDYIDLPKPNTPDNTSSPYGRAERKYNDNYSFESPDRPPKVSPKQTPKSILKESNSGSAHKPKRHIVINEQFNKTHNIDQPIDTQSSAYEKETASFRRSDFRPELTSDSSASQLSSKRSLDKVIGKVDTNTSSDDSFRDRFIDRATTVQRFNKQEKEPNLRNSDTYVPRRNIEASKPEPRHAPRTELDQAEIERIKKQQQAREQELYNHVRSYSGQSRLKWTNSYDKDISDKHRESYPDRQPSEKEISSFTRTKTEEPKREFNATYSGLRSFDESRKETSPSFNDRRNSEEPNREFGATYSGLRPSEEPKREHTSPYGASRFEEPKRKFSATYSDLRSLGEPKRAVESKYERKSTEGPKKEFNATYSELRNFDEPRRDIDSKYERESKYERKPIEEPRKEFSATYSGFRNFDEPKKEISPTYTGARNHEESRKEFGASQSPLRTFEDEKRRTFLDYKPRSYDAFDAGRSKLEETKAELSRVFSPEKTFEPSRSKSNLDYKPFRESRDSKDLRESRDFRDKYTRESREEIGKYDELRRSKIEEPRKYKDIEISPNERKFEASRKLSVIDEKFSKIEQKINAIERDLGKYQKALNDELSKEKEYNFKFGKAYETIDNKVKTIKDELNRSFDRSKTEDREPAEKEDDYFAVSPNSRTLARSRDFSDFGLRSSSFSKTSYAPSLSSTISKFERSNSMSKPRKKGSTGDIDLLSEVERLRRENELLRLKLEEKQRRNEDRDRKDGGIKSKTSSKFGSSGSSDLLEAIERIKSKLRKSASAKKGSFYDDDYNPTPIVTRTKSANKSQGGVGNAYLDALKKRVYGDSLGYKKKY